ncbi:hypothetical protein [Brevundimonas variabilis]|uniref:Uncharacterized protein n=1 Tax=Brevundimonas variabilis TaxID=74312 RepID=A0A7W9CGR2_9CAUL|nr:hypothetical protein [Brevundimonas variabilis]MBB5745206.1 hypothetical protein [Brevundimonas variabilis]
MTENTNGSGGNVGLAFIVGGLLVVVAVLAWFMFGRGGAIDNTSDINVEVELPEVSAPAVPGSN